MSPLMLVPTATPAALTEVIVGSSPGTGILVALPSCQTRIWWLPPPGYDRPNSSLPVGSAAVTIAIGTLSGTGRCSAVHEVGADTVGGGGAAAVALGRGLALADGAAVAATGELSE